MIKAGDKFGRLTVERFVFRVLSCDYFNCRCECGEQSVVSGYRLINGGTKSCGCLRGKAHGLRYTPEYYAWGNMIKRCYNPNNNQYQNYGKRKIKVCQRWRESFLAFLEDMGERPSKNHSIDRKENNGNYCKENCRWATPSQQQRNSRQNRILKYKGRAMCVTAWAEELGLKPALIFTRLWRGWNIKRALTEKPKGLKYGKS